MPWKVEYEKGERPYKIKRADTGETVGSSDTRAKALASTRARYMHSHDVGKSLSEIAKGYAEYKVTGAPYYEEHGRKNLLGKRKKVRKTPVELRTDEGGVEHRGLSDAEMHPSYAKRVDEFSIGKAGREDWKNITELEEERARHRRTKRQGAALAGAGATGFGAGTTFYLGRNGLPSRVSYEHSPVVRGTFTEMPRKNISAINIGQRPPGTAYVPNGPIGITRFGNRPKPPQILGPPELGPKSMISVGNRPGGLHIRFTKPAAAIAAGTLAAMGAGAGMWGYGAAQDRRKAKMVAQRRKERARPRTAA